MACKELSTILKFSFGIAPRKVEYGDIKTSTRFYASAGGLYPIDIYLYINVDSRTLIYVSDALN
ncbi:hypothetical protein AAGX78_01295 [Staphylococcus aureus]|nr:hypothetical protein [Staphylococcus aureus]MDI0205836.1 hypothetical protein [Staphylococcus aureus]MDI0239587.1 hypothetical protein [Staphylococcus aureus]